MCTVQGEAVVNPEPIGQGVGDVGSQISYRAAPVTHDVDVLVLRGTVAGRPVPEVGVPNQAQLLEELDGAVHRGYVDAGHSLGQLLRRGVAQVADSVQHLTPLRRHTQAAFMQLARQI